MQPSVTLYSIKALIAYSLENNLDLYKEKMKVIQVLRRAIKKVEKDFTRMKGRYYVNELRLTILRELEELK